MGYLIGQVLGILATVVSISMPMLRKKWQMLTATIGCNLLLALNFILIGQMGSGAYLCFVAIIQSIVSMNHTVKGTRASTAEQFLFLGLYIVSGIFGIVTAPGFVMELSYANLLEPLPIIGAVILTFSIFAPDEQTTRKYLLANITIWAVYTALIGSTTFFAEMAAFITTATALYKYRK